MSASAAMYDADHAGWIYKQGSMIKSWKKRFMVLRGKQLTYYDTAQLTANVKEKGSFQVITVELSSDIQNGLLVHGRGGRVLKLYTDSAQHTNGWYHAIMDAVTGGAHSTAMDLNEQRLSQLTGNNAVVDVDAHLDLLERLDSLPIEETQIQHEGWLTKEGMRVKSWKRRWFTLHGDILSYYNSTDTGSAAKGYGRVRAVEVHGGHGDKLYCLNIRYDNGRILRVCAESSTEMEEWLCKISDAIEVATHETNNARQSSCFRHSLAANRQSTSNLSFPLPSIDFSHVSNCETQPTGRTSIKGFNALPRHMELASNSFHDSSGTASSQHSSLHSSEGNQTESGVEYCVDSDESDGDWI